MIQFLTAQTATGGGLTVFLPIILLFAIMYFIMIRPENKKRKEADAMRSSLSVGDRITTIGGIVGTIVNIKDDNIVIESGADRVRIELAKWSVSNNNTAEEKKAAEAKAAKAEREARKAKKKEK